MSPLNAANADKEVTRVELTSVGVDVGTTTSHLIVSKLTLMKMLTRTGPRFLVTSREIMHKGSVFLTPLVDGAVIDIKTLADLFRLEFEKAGISPDEIDTGAVIITGESAKKQNAEELVHQLSEEVGKFVCAVAGPNFESLLSARGSGAVDYSKNNEMTILNCDIGGGTSNIALVKNGEVIGTSCINVGARLVATDENGLITRVETPIKHVENVLGKELALGVHLSENEKRVLAKKLQEALFEGLTQEFTSGAGMSLMMTDLLEEPLTYDAIMFSGGVAEFIYGKIEQEFGDLGKYLSEAINENEHLLPAPVLEPPETIRATVIGAGQYTLQVSGVTTHVDSQVLPLHNLPVVIPHFNKEDMSHAVIVKAIRDAYRRLDLRIDQDLAAMYFKGPIGGSYGTLAAFSQAVVDGAKPQCKDNGLPLIMVFERDIANSVGNVMVRETALHKNIISIDELQIQEGDFIDIGVPRAGGQMVPIVIKSLVFGDTSS